MHILYTPENVDSYEWHINCVYIYRWGSVAEMILSSSSVIGISFATKIGSNFIIGVRNTTHHKPQPVTETFSFWFLGQNSFVTIHLIG